MTDLLEEEYKAVKDIMVSHIRLSPYDPKKELHLIIDGASSIGVGFVLIQYLDDQHPEKGALIINANSSMLSEQQVGYSPIDTELIGLDFACKACHYCGVARGSWRRHLCSKGVSESNWGN